VLLNHTVGLPEYFEQKGLTEALKADPDREWTPAERLAFGLAAKPLFMVGNGWSYADTDYILAGIAAERAGGKPLFDEVDGRLLRPLNSRARL
jgi:D-alanyl-D-alanine carboxypeptidase